MSGYDLNAGNYKDVQPTEDDIWAVFSHLFSSKTKNTSSYKYGFLKSILDNLYNVDDELVLTFDQLFAKFAEMYWNLILKHNLLQQADTKGKKGSLIEQILNAMVIKYEIALPVSFESLSGEITADITHEVKRACKRYVVGALYADTNELFYSFSKKGEWLKISPYMYEFLCKHKVAIEKINYYEWAKFLEKINDGQYTSKLLNKIDESSKRNNLAIYRTILYQEFENDKCFYCGKVLKPDDIDVDHFIPWSFVKDDNIWNLVLSCKSCNRKKSDKLPSDYFVRKIFERNNYLIERYPTTNYSHERMEKLYHWAQVNGFTDDWHPKDSTNTFADYYENNAMEYFEKTKNADMTETLLRFTSLIKQGATIIDVGAGSGRDLLWFKKHNFKAEGIDSSASMCKIAQNYSGCNVECAGIENWKPKMKYDALWANAVLMHLKKEQMITVLKNIGNIIQLDGIAYFSLKYGTGKDVDSSGRYFSYYTEECVLDIIASIDNVDMVEMWISEDKLNRSQTKWINCILKLVK